MSKGPKEKECADSDCTNTFLQFNSLQKYCSGACKAKNTNTTPKKRAPIKPISDKRAKELAEYRIVRDKYKEENPQCEKCGDPMSDIHHKNGRNGKRVSDSEYFMSVCRPCHTWIHENPEDARAMGWLI
jgi:5-methylcytosine-specific restriction endonuclease McrA